MPWEVILHPEFDDWFQRLDSDEQDAILEDAKVLEAFGPMLGRPRVDHVKGARLKNLKELRVRQTGQPIRVLFAFDPDKKAILLVGGNKAGDKGWYKKNIPIAEKQFSQHVKEQENEEKNP
jgi:hypothetical protein